MDNRKIYCEVIEGIVYDDRCLFKLSKVIENSKKCENCILRELEKIKSPKTKASDISSISSVSSDIKRSRRIKGRSEKGSKPTEKGNTKQMYSSKELSGLFGRHERTLQKLAEKGEIPAVRIGRKWRFSKEEINRWLSKRNGGGGGAPQSEEQQESTIPFVNIPGDPDHEREGTTNGSSFGGAII